MDPIENGDFPASHVSFQASIFGGFGCVFDKHFPDLQSEMVNLWEEIKRGLLRSFSPKK